MPITNVCGARVAILTGSHESMGTEHGHLLADDINEFIVQVLRKSETLIGVPYEYLRKQTNTLWRFVPEQYHCEMKAIAEASGTDFEDIMIINALPDLDAAYSRVGFHCCNFALSGALTKEGSLVHGRNLDYPLPPAVHKSTAVLFVRLPEDSKLNPTFSVGWAGHVGIYTGCNGKGLSIGEVGVPCSDSTLEGVPLGLRMRQVLDRSSCLRDARFLLNEGLRTCGFNILVASGEEDTACAFETTRTIFDSRTMENGVLVVDDLCLGPSSTNRLTYAAGVVRHVRLMQRLTDFPGKISHKDAAAVLLDTYDAARGVTDGVSYNCIMNRHTVHSVLFMPKELVVKVAYDAVPASHATSHRLDLKPLFDLSQHPFESKRPALAPLPDPRVPRHNNT